MSDELQMTVEQPESGVAVRSSDLLGFNLMPWRVLLKENPDGTFTLG